MIVTLLLAVLSAQASELPNTVTYEVPTTPALAPFARFEIPYAAEEHADGSVSLTYTLPATLLGRDREFHLAGTETGATYALHGEDADMSCTEEADSVTCRVAHHGVAVDLAGVKAALDGASLSPVEKQGRFELASAVAREGGDLVGILRLPKPYAK